MSNLDDNEKPVDTAWLLEATEKLYIDTVNQGKRFDSNRIEITNNRKTIDEFLISHRATMERIDRLMIRMKWYFRRQARKKKDA